MRATYLSVITLLWVALSPLCGYCATTRISTLEQLMECAAKDNQHITMKGGTYRISDPAMAKVLTIKKYSATSAKEGQKGSDYPITTYLHFSGSNNTFDLEGVNIKLAGELHAAAKTGHIFEMFVTGDNNTIRGLSIADEGDVAPTKGSAIMAHVMGDDNTLEGVNLFIKGSSPYGYGHLLGKGKPTGLVDLHKHSSLLVSGCDTRLIDCRVITRGYGHGIVMQGAVNTYIEGCYVEGAMRPTDAMLKETKGVAYESGFKTIYPPGVIEPGRMIALSEDGVRTYPYGGYVGRRTRGVTVVNTTIKNMRSGVDLGVHIPPTVIKGCTTIGCQEKGYAIGSQAVITDSRGDAMYGPLLTFQGTSAKDCYVELELLPTVSKYKVERVAEINGSGHYIKLTSYNSERRQAELPILFGESFWGDVHAFRQPNEDMSKFVGARNITLVNETGMPTRLTQYSEDCLLFTNGDVSEDKGKNNTVHSTASQIKVFNKGVAGNTSANLISRADVDVVALRPDLTIILVGANDMLNSKRVTSYEQYRKNIIRLVEIIEGCGSEVMLLSALPADSEYLFERHDKSKYTAHPDVMMAKAKEIVEEIASQYACHFVDLYSEFVARGIPTHNEDIYLRNMKNSRVKDGVHPTPAGYQLISDIIWQYLESHSLQTKYKRVVCLGDSITKGSGAKGGGTVTGENYPSRLNQKLNNL